MKEALRRTWAPILAVILAQLFLNSSPVAKLGDGSRLFAKVFLFLALFLMTSFVGGAVHAGLLRRRADVGLSVCFLDGSLIGLIANLTVQLLSTSSNSATLDLFFRPSGEPDPAVWLFKLILWCVIMMIFGFAGLLCGGAGGGLVGLVSIWMAGPKTAGERHG